MKNAIGATFAAAFLAAFVVGVLAGEIGVFVDDTMPRD